MILSLGETNTKEDIARGDLFKQDSGEESADCDDRKEVKSTVTTVHVK